MNAAELYAFGRSTSQGKWYIDTSRIVGRLYFVNRGCASVQMASEIRELKEGHFYILPRCSGFSPIDAKDFDLKGSEALWSMIEYGKLRNPISGETITKDKITLMVNIDQIGSSLAPVNKERTDYMIMLGTQSLRRDRRELLHRCNLEEGIGMDISLDYYGSDNFTKIFYRLSDQRVFVDNKLPAVLFTSGITMNNNKTWDRTENLDLEVYIKRIRLMYHWIEKML